MGSKREKVTKETTKENKKKETLEKERIVKEKQRKELVPKELLGKERRNKREKTGKEVKTKESEKKSKILVRTKINCQIALKHGKEEVVKEVANYQKMLTDLPDGSKCKDTACLCMVQKAAATQFKIANQLTEDRKTTQQKAAGCGQIPMRLHQLE